MIAAGTPAPPFTLRTADGEPFTREDLLGHTSVLIFYPYAFTSVCADQLSLYEEVLPELAEQGATAFAISTDSVAAQAAFAERLGSSIAQLSDFEPKGAASRAFGVLHAGGPSAARAGDRRPRRRRRLELPGALDRRPAGRQPDLRRSRKPLEEAGCMHPAAERCMHRSGDRRMRRSLTPVA